MVTVKQPTKQYPLQTHDQSACNNHKIYGGCKSVKPKTVIEAFMSVDAHDALNVVTTYGALVGGVEMSSKDDLKKLDALLADSLDGKQAYVVTVHQFPRRKIILDGK